MATYTAVGGASILNPTVSGTATPMTFSFTPTAVHSYSIWAFTIAPTSRVLGLVTDTQGNVWTQLSASRVSTFGASMSLWSCLSVSTSAATVSVAFSGSGSVTAHSANGKEFTSSNGLLGTWVVDTAAQTGDATASGINITGFPVTTTIPGVVIFENFFVFSTGIAGATAGFQYVLDPNTNIYCWAVNSTGAAQTPTATGTSGQIYARYAVSFRNDLPVVPGPIPFISGYSGMFYHKDDNDSGTGFGDRSASERQLQHRRPVRSGRRVRSLDSAGLRWGERRGGVRIG